MTAPQKWSQNILIAPWCLAAALVINPASFMLANETWVKLKKKNQRTIQMNFSQWFFFLHFRWFLSYHSGVCWCIYFSESLVLISNLCSSARVKTRAQSHSNPPRQARSYRFLAVRLVAGSIIVLWGRLAWATNVIYVCDAARSDCLLRQQLRQLRTWLA